MRSNVSTSAAAWLAAGPIRIADPKKVLATFKPGTAQVVRFSGSHGLLRAAGWSTKDQRQASAYGSWWVDEHVLANIAARLSMYEGWLPPKMIGQAVSARYRAAVALCEDWNDMGEVYRMQLGALDTLEGLAGITAPQPQASSMDPRQSSTPMLAGGAEQIFFKKTPGLSSINPLWVYRHHLI